MKRFNINELLWFIILVSFAYFIYELFDTRKINLYIHPKMFKYVWFSFFVFVLLGIFQIRRILTSNKIKKVKFGYIIFIVPLFLAFAVNPDSLSAQVVSNKGANIANNSLNSKEEVRIQNNENCVQLDTDTNNENIDIYDNADAEAFKDTLVNAYSDLDSMIGKEVELCGFVFRESDFDINRFVISRLLMSCCAADTQIAGLLCEWDEGGKLQDNEWIKVTGTMDTTLYFNEYINQEENVPIIRVTQVDSIKAPENQYIYP